MNQLYVNVLRENIDKLNLSAEWIKRSYEKACKITSTKDYSTDDFDSLEVLASRYARTTDLLVNKVLRSIDTVEYEDIGTIIDIMNRAEKRRIVSSAESLRTIKDLRNSIVHEYRIDEIAGFFADILRYTPVLLEIIDKVNIYCEKYFSKKN